MLIARRLGAFLRRPAVRHGTMVVLDQGLLSIATFVTGALLARATTKEAYGVYVLGLSVVLLFQGCQRALVNVPFTVYAPKLHGDEQKAYQGSAFLHTLILCALVSIAMPIACLLSHGTYESLSSEADACVIFSLLGVVTASFFLREFIRNVLLARLQIWAGVAVNCSATGLQLAITGWLFAAHRLTLTNTFEVMAATSALAAGYMIWSHRGQMRIVTRRVWRDFLHGFRTGKWVLIDVFAYMAASQAYPWLVLYFSDARQVAVFGVCAAFAGLPGPFARGAGAYIQPRMVHGYKDGNIASLSRLLGLSFRVMCIPYFAWLLIGSAFANELIGLIYGRSYSGYAVLATLLLIRVVIEGVSSPLSQALQTLERADVATLGLVIAAILTLALGSLLIMQLGLEGAGIAAVAASLASAAFKWTALRRILRQPARKVETTGSI